MRPWGKNEGSFWRVELSAIATEKLREHMTRFRSTPNPKACEACRAEKGEHVGPGKNPHRECDFADNAPVWINPATGARLKPVSYTDTIAPRAAILAGLTPEHIGFKLTPKVQRFSGATLLLEAGWPIAEVRRMGRWTNDDTPLKHYHRTRDEHRSELFDKFDDEARAQLGLDVRDDAHIGQRLTFAERSRQRAEDENVLLREALAAAGVDPDDVITRAAPERMVFEIRRPSAFADEETVCEAITSSTTRAEILRKLGIAAAKKNYVRLEAFAAEHDIALPGKWGRKTA